MSSDFEWGRMLFAMGLLIAMFLYPVLSLWYDGRKQRGDPPRNIDECNPAEDDPWLCTEPSERQTTAEVQPDGCSAPGSPASPDRAVRRSEKPQAAANLGMHHDP